MTKSEHVKRHQKLHNEVDELVADWVNETKGLPSKTSIAEFLAWSHQQTIEPADRLGVYRDPA